MSDVTVTFFFEGKQVVARAGTSVAMALYEAGVRDLRRSSRCGEPRGVLCNMGICYECLMVMDGVVARACMTTVASGMQVARGGRP